MSTTITDHVAILLRSSLDQARESKAKPGKHEFYAQLALPPQARDALMDACKSAAPNGSLNGLQVAPKLHSSLADAKRFAGIPLDWFIVRMSSGPDYPPELFAESGQKIAALPLNSGQIRTEFYAGQRVRINSYPFHYPAKNGGSAGVAFNLSGLMAVGGGERRAGDNGGESSESAFAKYRNADAPAQETVFKSTDAVNAGGASASADPFQQAGGASASADPFA